MLTRAPSLWTRSVARRWLSSTSATRQTARAPTAPRPKLDYRFIAENADALAANIAARKVDGDPHLVARLYADVRARTGELQALQHERNLVSLDLDLLIQESKIKAGDDISKQDQQDWETRKRDVIARGKQLKAEIGQLETTKQALEAELLEAADCIPNTTHPETPIGDESQARVIELIGARDEEASAHALGHVELAQRLGVLDLEAAARVAGAGFAVLRGEAALLEMALTQWSMQRVVQAGFTPLMVPDVVRTSVSEACGFKPRDPSLRQNYLLDGTDLCLAGTAEVAVAGMHVNQMLSGAELPLKYVAYGHAFRTEAGARGVAAKGLYRMHQFSKTEMFALCAPEQSEELFDELCTIQKTMYGELRLHFRMLEMPTEELGAPAHRKVDVEAWMPGRGEYGEVFSASNCTDYQARRLNTRFRPEPKASPRFVHTLNATACAIPRMIIAVLEQNQRADGTVAVPKVLQGFMGGMERIGKV